jgi:hypothetical protein
MWTSVPGGNPTFFDVLLKNLDIIFYLPSSVFAALVVHEASPWLPFKLPLGGQSRSGPPGVDLYPNVAKMSIYDSFCHSRSRGNPGMSPETGFPLSRE